MNNKYLAYGIILTLVVAIGGYMFPKMSTGTGLFGSTACSSITCLSGGLRLVSDAGGDFESDVAAVFASTVNIAGATTFTSTFKLGTNGTTESRINSGFCNIQASGTTIAASSTKVVDCGGGTTGGTALTGVTAGDRCFLGQSTTTPATSNGLIIAGASASSTAGFITAVLSNLTGGTFTWTAAASTSLPYHCES